MVEAASCRFGSGIKRGGTPRLLSAAPFSPIEFIVETHYRLTTGDGSQSYQNPNFRVW
jgi:hypothetical protein